MNARVIVAATAVLCLTASASFAQPTPQTSSQPSLTTASAPRAWAETTPQPPAAAPRPGRPGAVNVEGEPQTPPPAQAPVAMTMPSSRTRGQLLNVKVEFTITDQVGTKPPVKKTMTMVVADRESSRIRTNVDYYTPRGNRSVPLSVDVSPYVEGNKIRLDFSVEYSTSEEVPADEKLAPAPKTNVSERLAAVFESGVPMVVAQSSDAYSDRKITIEIKATITK